MSKSTRAGKTLLSCFKSLSLPRSGWVPANTVRWASTGARQWSTPLAKNIAEAIVTTGPISIAAYMRQCLTSPDGGYYTSRTTGKDQFGASGDFVTSPEISQIFGELCGIWMVTEWMAQGRKKEGVQIIEVGPGRGTLMDDMLRTITNFRSLSSAVEQVYLVEASSALRDAQKDLLCAGESFEEVEDGLRCKSKYAGMPITWYEDIRFVPNESSKMPFIFAHEFFDALPIHAFQSVAPAPNQTVLETPTGPLPLSNKTSQARKPQWRELVVSPTPPPSVLIPKPKSNPPPPDFQLSVAKASTPPALFLPTVSARYRALLAGPDSVIEISPESHSYAAEFARRIGGSNLGTTASSIPSMESVKQEPSGAALILDYGPLETIPTNTLRGIQAHKQVSPFSLSGLVDLSADVDFTALAEASTGASGGVEVHGPVEQGFWLESVGIRERLQMLCRGIDKESGTTSESKEKKKAEAKKAVERLVERSGGGMGRIYKAMAIIPEGGGKRRPVGFGGDVKVV